MTSLLFDGRFLLGHLNGISVDTKAIFDCVNELDFEISILVNNQNAKLLAKIYPKLNQVNYGNSIFSLIKSQFKPYLIPENYDLLYFSQFHPLKIKTQKKTLTIYRVHDFFPITNPGWFKYRNIFSFRLGKKNILNNHYLLPTSEYVAHVLNQYGFTSDKTEILPCPVFLEKTAKCNYCDGCRFDFNCKYGLTVGTLEPRKNYEKILLTSKELKEKNFMVVVGNRGWKSRRIHSRISQNRNIILLNQVCNDSLKELFSNSQFYISLSHDEGFDIPMNVAKTFEKFIIASKIPVHIEKLNNYENSKLLSRNETLNLNDFYLKNIEGFKFQPNFVDLKNSWNSQVKRIFGEIVQRTGF